MGSGSFLPGKKGVRFISRIFAEWGQVHFSLHGERAQIHYCDATLIWHLSDCRPFTAGKQAACPASRSAGQPGYSAYRSSCGRPRWISSKAVSA